MKEVQTMKKLICRHWNTLNNANYLVSFSAPQGEDIRKT